MKKIIILLFLVVITSYSATSSAYSYMGSSASVAVALQNCQIYANLTPGNPTCIAYYPSSFVSTVLCVNKFANGYVFDNSVDSSAYTFFYSCTDSPPPPPPPSITPFKGKPVDCINGSTGFWDSATLLWTALTTTPASSNYLQCEELAGLERGLTDLEDVKPLKPGESKTCMNGSVVTYPETCSTRLLLQIVPVVGIGQPSTRVAEMELVPYADDEFKLLMNMESKITNAAGDTITGNSQMFQEIPPAAVAQGFSDFLKTPAGVATAAAIVAGSAGLLTSDTDGNIYSPYNGSEPLTPNQTLEAAKVFNVPIPQGATQYIPLDYAPQIQTGVDDVNRDFGRMFDGDAATSPTIYTPANFGPTPFLFDDLLNRPTVSPYIKGISPLATSPVAPPPNLALAPSPLVPPPDTVNLPNPNPNPTPTPTPDPTPTPTPTPNPNPTITTSPSPTGTVTDLGPAPVAPATPAGPGNLQDFLNMPNPFTMSLPAWFPSLPEPSCTYEIHTTIFQRPFDLAPCVPLQPLRAVLQWAFSILTIWVCFKIVFKPNGMGS